MHIIDPSYEFLTPLDATAAYSLIEKAARTCYKSEDKIREGTDKKMVKMLVDKRHFAMIEFAPDIVVKFVTNRGFSHELVRHRIASFAQESTRYCTYSADKFGNEITLIKPYWWNDNHNPLDSLEVEWLKVMQEIEDTYLFFTENGLQAQAARGVLPNDLKTEIVIKANIREWRNIFQLRTAIATHPDMRRLMIPLLQEFKQTLPLLFEDIELPVFV